MQVNGSGTETTTAERKKFNLTNFLIEFPGQVTMAPIIVIIFLKLEQVIVIQVLWMKAAVAATAVAFVAVALAVAVLRPTE